MIAKHCIVICSIAIISLGCSKNHTEVSHPIDSASFNSMARDYILSHFHESDFIPLRPSAICYLRETIKNDLDQFAEQKLSRSNGFTIRHYRSDFDFHFGIVSGADSSFYLISLPMLYRFWTDPETYCDEQGNMFFPRDSFRLMDIESKQLNRFIANEVSHKSEANVENSELLDDLLPILFPEFTNEISEIEFRNRYKEEIKSLRVNNQLAEILANNGSSRHFCDLKGLGCVIFFRSVNTNPLKQQIFFLPKEQFRRNFRSDVLPPYEYCAELDR